MTSELGETYGDWLHIWKARLACAEATLKRHKEAIDRHEALISELEKKMLYNAYLTNERCKNTGYWSCDKEKDHAGECNNG